MPVTHTYLGQNGLKTEQITRARAIQQKCLECSGFSVYEVVKCHIKDCALYPYRTLNAQQKPRKRDK